MVRPKLWAEDGAVFLTNAYQTGAAGLFEPYAGYLHVVPRLIAKLGSWMPVEVVPGWFLICSWLLLAWSLSEVASQRFTALRAGAVPRIAIGCGLCLAPGLVEVFGNLANLHSVAVLWLSVIAARAAGTRLNRAERVALVLCVFSAGEAVLLLPLFCLRSLAARFRGPGQLDDRLAAGALAIAALVNAAHHFADPADLPAPVGEVIPAALHAVAWGLAIEPLAGSRGAAAIWTAAPALYVVLAVGLIGLLAAAALRDRTRQTWPLAASVASVAFLPLLTGLVRSTWLALIASGPTDAFAWWRHSFHLAPIGLIAWAVLLSRWRSGGAEALPASRWSSWPAGALGVAAVLLALPRWGIDELQGPRWRPTLEQARSSPTGACAAGAAFVNLPIAPAGWFVTLPRAKLCGR